jgi:hypothetical protein
MEVMSSKRAAAQGAKELLIEILRLLAKAQGMNTEQLNTILEPKYHQHPAAKLWYMERRGYVRHIGNTYVITPHGKKILSERQLWELTIPTPRVWNGKWHLVLFDIPVDKRKRRDVFRLHLKKLGFAYYQNSVWIYPHPCEDIIRTISDFYYLSRCVSFVVAEKLTGEKRFLDHFGLR